MEQDLIENHGDYPWYQSRPPSTIRPSRVPHSRVARHERRDDRGGLRVRRRRLQNLRHNPRRHGQSIHRSAVRHPDQRHRVQLFRRGQHLPNALIQDMHGCTDGSGAICITTVSAPGTWNAGKLFVEPAAGAYVRITGVTGVTQANGVWTVNLTNSNTNEWRLNNSTWTGSGAVGQTAAVFNNFVQTDMYVKWYRVWSCAKGNHSMQRPRINHITLTQGRTPSIFTPAAPRQRNQPCF
jgi:hypothetical protein